MYAETRADDLVVNCIRELLRHPELPGSHRRCRYRRNDADRRPGPDDWAYGCLACWTSRSVPGFAIDRMCAGAMTAVTTTAGIAFGAYDVTIAGGVEHMGHHPMGEGIDPNPGSSPRSSSISQR